MKENTKKALYESIMQKVSQQVVEMLNENNSINEGFINRYNNAENGTFMALDKLIDNYNSFMFDEPRKGLFIKVSNPDLGFAIASMLTAHYKNRTE